MVCTNPQQVGLMVRSHAEAGKKGKIPSIEAVENHMSARFIKRNL